MLQTLKNLFVLALIVFIIAVPASIFAVKFANKIPIGMVIKKDFIKYPLLVKLINLNEPGDNRYAYVKARDPITVRVFYQSDYQPNDQVTFWLNKLVNDTTGRDVDVSIYPDPLGTNDLEFSDANLNYIHNKLPPTEGKGPVLNVVYLAAYTDAPTYVGLTLHRDTIFVFKKTILLLSNDKAQLSDIEQSTIMHEWGHLLGMEHNDLPECIMSANFDVYNPASGFVNRFQTQYCGDELDQLDLLRKSAIK